ncbi:MAG: hypothetical protein Q4G59_05900, partial [Planctomycetia bacterium]|nr:hypothetical protein [Planctomycetia bacterium]
MAKKIDMNDPRIVQLEQLFVSDDMKYVPSFFKDMPESDRQFLAPVVLAWVKKLTFECYKLRGPIAFAVLATCSFDEIKKSERKLRQAGVSMNSKIVVEAMKQRKPSWIVEFLIWLMHYESPMWVDGIQDPWNAYWELRQEGVCPPIYDPAVLFRMVQSQTLDSKKFYRDHPELLQNEFWYLFEMEFPTPFWFSSHDKSLGDFSEYCYLPMYLEFVQ